MESADKTEIPISFDSMLQSILMHNYVGERQDLELILAQEDNITQMRED